MNWRFPFLTPETAEEHAALEARSTEPVSIDDWVRAGGKCDFAATVFSEHLPEGEIECSIRRAHQGNTVFAKGRGNTTGDAFWTAIANIEKTIGTAWRQS